MSECKHLHMCVSNQESHEGLEAKIAELKEKLNISATKDLVWITRDEIKELDENRIKIVELEAHIERLRGRASSIIELNMNNYGHEDVEFINNGVIELCELANETPKQSLAHIKQDAIWEMVRTKRTELDASVFMASVPETMRVNVTIALLDYFDAYADNLTKEK